MEPIDQLTSRELLTHELDTILHTLDQSTIVAVTDAEWNITYANDRFCSVSGYSRDELIGQNHRILNSGIHPKTFWINMYAELNAGRTWTGTIQNRAKNGSYYWVDSTISPIVDDKGNLVGALALRYETTALQQSLQELLASNDRTQFALKGCVEGLFQYESSTDTIWFSERFHELLKAEPNSLGNDLKALISRIHPFDLAQLKHAPLDDLFKNGDAEAEFRLRHPCGEYNWYRVVSKCFKERSGKEWSVSGSISDIEILKQRELEVVQSRIAAETASRAKMDFLSCMSHELRTPMTAILGYLDILDDSIQSVHPEDEQSEVISIIKRNASHLLSLINDILDVSKIDAGKMTIEQMTTNTKPIIVDVVTLLQPQAEAKGIQLLYNIEQSVPTKIDTDPTRLRQILINLVGNAIKFTDEGSVTINARLNQRTGLLEIAVQDTGIGMTQEHLEAINKFDMFNQADASTTRKFGGTGLGLHISHVLANLLGGGIDVESQSQAGSTFTLRLGVGQSQEHNSNHELNSTDDSIIPSPTPKKMNILLAEDNPDIQKLFRLYLKKLDADITVVDNGQLAINAIQSNTHSPFDLVLMDMHMPVLDGSDAVVQLRNQNCSIPIIAVTADSSDGASEKYKKIGCNAYLAKPTSKDALIHACSQWASCA